MSFRFRKSIKIAPGIRVNFSKSGVSTSIGKRGATVNISKKAPASQRESTERGYQHLNFTHQKNVLRFQCLELILSLSG